MATIPSGTRFIGISQGADLSERKSTLQNSLTEPYTIVDIKDYVQSNTKGIGLFAQTVSSANITNTNVETSLIGSGVGSLSVPANGFQVGDSFHAKLIGHISANSSATLRLRFKSGSVVLADTGIVDLDTISNRHWEINTYFTIRSLGSAGTASIASGGIFSYTKNSGLNFEGTNFSIINNTTFDTTVVNTLNVTAQWGAANAADSIYSELFTLSRTY
jgi:hypothetical protein